MPAPLIEYNTYRGIDNVSDPARIKQGYWREADNIDSDDEGMIHRRDGANTQVLSGSGIHSFWSDGTTALFVQGTDFKKFNADYSATTLVSPVDPNDRMAYVKAPDRVFFSNSRIVGYVLNGLSYSFPNPDRTFKIRMVGGQILEWFYGRLYAANGRIIYYSDATVPTRMDTRKNAIPMPDRVTMMVGVVDGLYIGTLNEIYFFAGTNPTNFKVTRISDVGVIEGTAIFVEDDDVGRGASGRTAYWLTENGPYKGYPGGLTVQMQQGLFEIENLERGTAITRWINGHLQYLAISQLKAGIGGADGAFEVPTPTT